MAENLSGIWYNIVGFLAMLVGVGAMLVSLFYEYNEMMLIVGVGVAIVGLLLQRVTNAQLERQRRRGA